MTDIELYKQKLEKDTNSCPHCGSKEIAASDYDGTNILSCTVICADCGMEWVEEYKRINFCGLQIPDHD